MKQKVDQICRKCGIAESDWRGSKGKGYIKNGQTYCCRGCAEDTVCTCLEEDGAELLRRSQWPLAAKPERGDEQAE